MPNDSSVPSCSYQNIVLSRNLVLMSFQIFKTKRSINLPRQARDKAKEKSQPKKRRCVSAPREMRFQTERVDRLSQGWPTRRPACRNVSLFQRFQLFVPSLSWQIFSFECYIKWHAPMQRDAFFFRTPGLRALAALRFAHVPPASVLSWIVPCVVT